MRLRTWLITGGAILLVGMAMIAASREFQRPRKAIALPPPKQRVDSEAIVQRGRQALERGEFEAALRDFDLARQSGGDSLQLFLLSGRAYYSLGEFDRAIGNFDRALELEPQNQEARALRGDAYYKKNDIEKAMADYAELRTPNGDFLASRTEQVRAAAKQTEVGRDTAIRDLVQKGNDLAQTGHSEEAIEIYTRLLRMDLPLSAASTVCQNRGNAFRARGEEEKAMQDYEQAIRFNPRNGGAYANRGLIFSGRGDTESALKDYDEALRLEPRLYEALLNRGIIYRNENELEKAEQDFERAIKLNPDFGQAYLNRGDIHLLQGKLEQALADFDAAEKLDPTLADAHYGRALVWQKKRAYTRSAAELDKALQLRSANRVDILNALAWLRATCRDDSVRDGKRAVALANEACAAKYWYSAQMVDTLAAAYAETGEFEQAVNYQRYALSLPNGREEDRRGAQQRLALYEQRRPFRMSESD